MKAKTKTVYYCEYCRRHMLSASAMSVHERFCPQRPQNRHKCFEWCGSLKMTPMLTGGHIEQSFTCTRIGCKLYSYKFERHIHFHPTEKLRPGTLRMPLTCPHYVDAEMEIRAKREREYQNDDE